MLRFKAKSIAQAQPSVSLNRQHISVRPTKLGITLLVVSMGVWIGAVNYQVNVAYLICFWIACFVGVGALLTQRQLLGLHIHIHDAGEAFVGDTINIEWTAKSNSKRPHQFWYKAANETNWQVCSLKNAESTNQYWAIALQQRGYYPSPLILQLSSAAPFGLFVAQCQIQWHTEAIVYPAPLTHEEHGQQPAKNDDKKQNNTQIHGEDIAYLNTHQIGSSLHRIAWKHFAKQGELLDKVFDAPVNYTRSDIISYQDYPSQISKDQLASLLAYRVLQAELHQQPYTLRLPNQTINSQNQQREKCLIALALL